MADDQVFPDSVAFRSAPGRLVQVMRGKLPLPYVDAMRRTTRDTARTRMVQLIVVRPRSVRDVPDPDVRAALAALLAEQPDPHVASAMVIEVGSFLGAIARSVMASVNWLSERESQQRNFTDVGEAARWLVERAPDLVTAADLRRDVDELAAALDRSSSSG